MLLSGCFVDVKNKSSISAIFIMIAASLWGTAGIFVRTLSGHGIGEMQLVFYRVVFAALFIALITLVKDRNLFKIHIKDIWLFAASGIVSIVLFNYCYYTTIGLTSLSAAAVLLYTAPFFVMIMSVPVFKERITVKKLLALFIAFLGCCLVTGVFGSSVRLSGKAVMFGLLTGFGYSMYTVLGSVLLKKGYNSLTVTFYTFLFASVGCLPFVNIGDTVKNITGSVNVTGLIILMALVNTVIPYIIYTVGLNNIDPSKAPIIATVEPVVATVIGAAVYKETLTLSGVIGIILVLSAVVVLNYKGGAAK